MDKIKQEQLRKLPSVDEVLSFVKKDRSLAVKNMVREELESIRQAILSNHWQENETITAQKVAINVTERLNKGEQFSLKKVINGTGTILHTNLGRSVLSNAIKQHIETIAFSNSNLEYDVENGSRGSRYSHLESLIQELTGAEAALVVNNNAAAVMLALNTLVNRKEVIISRGELVEIGGSFRIPEVINLSGGQLREVGTTNKTHLVDYETALTEETGAILKVHTSNYQVIGFTESVVCSELSGLAHQNQLPLIYDAGSGLLVDLQKYGLPHEPTISELVAQGCDVITFSGDKLLGGPQAGIIVGKRTYIEAMKKNQLLRALRVDKLTLAALEATLTLYLDEKQAMAQIPTLNMIQLSEEACLKKAEKLKQLVEQVKGSFEIDIQQMESEVGGGSYPEISFPTYSLLFACEKLSETELEEKFRTGPVPILGRIKKGKYMLDVRTIAEEDFERVAEAFACCISQ